MNENAMNKCPRCFTELKENAVICGRCGRQTGVPLTLKTPPFDVFIVLTSVAPEGIRSFKDAEECVKFYSIGLYNSDTKDLYDKCRHYRLLPGKEIDEMIANHFESLSMMFWTMFALGVESAYGRPITRPHVEILEFTFAQQFYRRIIAFGPLFGLLAKNKIKEEDATRIGTKIKELLIKRLHECYEYGYKNSGKFDYVFPPPARSPLWEALEPFIKDINRSATPQAGTY